MDEGTLQSIFGAYGAIKRCKLLQKSPSGNHAAIIEFDSQEEATWIVDNLNGNIPQGLEEPIVVRYKEDNRGSYGKATSGKTGDNKWQPYGSNSTAVAIPDGGKGKDKNQTSISVLVAGLFESGALPGGTRYCNDDSTIFVSGLPHDTTDGHLFNIFSCFGAIAPQGVRAMPTDDKSACKGYGFVNFLDSKSAAKAISTLNGTTMPCGLVMTLAIKRNTGKGCAKGSK
eukprot:TRINITY_DN18088_c0_g1_i1.p1 TRINITY_DN18088_c0_g1~~TRINITY_DN18088_c0_g1_i1.p1  ORF type:complete len:268 (+),score=39.69 TRINITY_DN18088_c0_g1_i1:121-804(+)